MRKLLNIACVFAFTLTLFSTDAAAAVSGDWEYNVELSGESVAITDYLGAAADAVIPGEIDGKPVSHIDSRAFWGTDITSVTIPDSVKYILAEAFWNCDKLVTVNMGNSVELIAQGAFDGCSALVNINIPEGVTRIGQGAFRDCVSLINITIPSTVGNYDWGSHEMFEGCVSLQTLIWNSGMSFPPGALYGCTALKEIRIYDRFGTLSESVFASDGVGEPMFPAGITIYAESGSPNQNFARNNSISFQPINAITQPTATTEPVASIGAQEQTVSGMKTGDYLGDVLYSDIMAYINGYPIPTSITNGRTMVVAEDLQNYGFNVAWDAVSWSLSISPNFGAVFAPLPVEQNTMPVGTVKCPYVYTTVKTYLSGEEVESFAIDGRTLIDFELLSKYGAVEWNGAERSISLILDGGTALPPSMPNPAPPISPQTPVPAADSGSMLGIEPFDLKWVDIVNGIISFSKGISDEEATALKYLYVIRLYVNEQSVGGAYYFPAAFGNPCEVDISHMTEGAGSGSYVFEVYLLSEGSEDVNSSIGNRVRSEPYIK